MEKVNLYFSKFKILALNFLGSLKGRLKSLVWKKESNQTSKKDFNTKNIIVMFFVFAGLFVVISLFMPTKQELGYHEVSKDSSKSQIKNDDTAGKKKSDQDPAKLWGSAYKPPIPQASSQNNYNTSMVVSPGGGNSKLELHAGTHLRIRIIDKFITSQEAVPVVAKVLEDATTESGLSIVKDTLIYGEASYQKTSGRALVQFKKLSYPSGEMRAISASVISSDGMPGLEGSVHSDGIKNSAGQIITTFVGGLASGSMQRDLLGNSTGGVTNGLLQAVSDTARDRAQKYGEGLKDQREWIEVSSNTDCEAIINQSFQMIESEAH